MNDAHNRGGYRSLGISAVRELRFLFVQRCPVIFCSVSLYLAVLCTSAFAVEIRTLTLDQALAIAMEKNHDIEKAREYARYVQGRYIEERSAALPQIGLNGVFGLSQDQSLKASAGSTPRQTSGSLELAVSQPLYTWGKIGAAIRAAEVGLKTADEQLKLYRKAVWRDVSSAWYDTLLAKELSRLAEENLAQKRRHLDEARNKFAGGVATDYDVLAAEVGVENARPEVIRTKNAIRISHDRLGFLLGISDEIKLVGTLASGSEPVSMPDFEDSLMRARKNRPEISDLRLRIGIYRELVTIASAENKPRLDLKGGVGWHSLSLDDSGPYREANGAAWNVGMYLTFPFFDGMKSSGKVMQAHSDLKTKEIEEQKLLDSITLEVRDSIYSLTEADEIIKALSGTVKQAERLLDMAEKGFQYGVKTRLDVDDAQLNLLQATGNLARAERDYQIARVNFQWSTGVLGK